MSKYHARKSSLQSRDQHGNSSPYCVICPPGGTCVVQVKAAPPGACSKIINKDKQLVCESRCASSRARECARKVRINGMTHVGVDGLYLAWTSPPSRAASLVCSHGKNAIKRSCVSRHSRLQKRAADLSFLLHTANGDIGLVVLPFAVLSRHCFTALLH
ncbi:hypothetical protein [Herbaspirillum sp. NPDC101397]|uniref:hypothetical protein n=1 Tax=Herbaspirillum sp. NPDC101397 TaxID=3364006 RepID=UPI00383BEB9E